MNFEDLSSEQKARAKACTSPEEILVFAKEEGYELADEELEAVSGGADWLHYCPEKNTPCDDYCPGFGSK